MIAGWWRWALVGLVVGACGAHQQHAVRMRQQVSPDAYRCLAVMPFDNLTQTSGAGLVVAGAVGAGLRATGRHAVLDPSAMIRMAELRRLDLSGSGDPKIMRTLRDEWGIDLLVRGRVREYWYTDDPDLYSDRQPMAAFRIEFVDTATGEMLYEATVASGASGFSPMGTSLSALTLALVSRSLDSWRSLQEPWPVYGVAPACVFNSDAFARGLLDEPAAVVKAPEPVASEPMVTVTPAVVAPIRELGTDAQELLEQIRTGQRGVWRGVRFEYKQAVFGEGTTEAVQALAEILERYPEMTVELSVHTDNAGSPEEMLILARDQGDAIRTYLRDTARLDAARVAVLPIGSNEPILPNINRRNRMINRRIEIRVTHSPAGGW